MKRADLIRAHERSGCELVRHAGKHDWYRSRQTGALQPVPRHREIGEGPARHILEAFVVIEPEGGDADRAGGARP